LSGASGYADGMGEEARFKNAEALALDAHGSLFVASGSTIRKGQLAGPPVISVQPASQIATAGANVQLAVTATGVPSPTFQWYRNDQAITGATASTLSLASVSAGDVADYTVDVINAMGRVTSAKATLQVTAAPTPETTPAAGGGGAMGAGFAAALLILGGVRRSAAA